MKSCYFTFQRHASPRPSKGICTNLASPLPSKSPKNILCCLLLHRHHPPDPCKRQDCQAMPHSLEAQGGFSHRILTEQARLDLLAQKQLCPPPVFCHWLIDQLVLLRDVPQLVKNPPATQETWVRSLGQENSPGGGHGDLLQYSGQ